MSKVKIVKSFSGKVFSFAKNMTVSTIKQIYHDAKTNAKDKHDIKMDINNLKKDVFEKMEKENNLLGKFKLSPDELGSIYKDVMGNIKSELSTSKIVKDEALLGLDFDEEFDDLDELDFAVEDIEIKISETCDNLAEPDDSTVVINKSKYVSLVYLFLISSGDKWVTDDLLKLGPSMFTEIVIQAGIDNDTPVDTIEDNNEDEIRENISNIENEIVLSGDLDKVTDNHVGTENKLQPEDFDDTIICGAKKLKNILDGIYQSAVNNTEVVSTIATIELYITRIFDYLNKTNSLNEHTLDSFLSYNRIIETLNKVYKDTAKVRFIYFLFYFGLVDKKLKDMLETEVLNITSNSITTMESGVEVY